MAILASPNTSDVTYAIGQLDQLSAGETSFGGLSDFGRAEVLMAVHGYITNPDSKIAKYSH